MANRLLTVLTGESAVSDTTEITLQGRELTIYIDPAALKVMKNAADKVMKIVREQGGRINLNVVPDDAPPTPPDIYGLVTDDAGYKRMMVRMGGEDPRMHTGDCFTRVMAKENGANRMVVNIVNVTQTGPENVDQCVREAVFAHFGMYYRGLGDSRSETKLRRDRTGQLKGTVFLGAEHRGEAAVKRAYGQLAVLTRVTHSGRGSVKTTARNFRAMVRKLPPVE